RRSPRPRAASSRVSSRKATRRSSSGEPRPSRPEPSGCGRRRRSCGRGGARRLADLARRMTREMGKPITQGEAEVEKCAWVCDYYADSAEGFLAVQPRETDAKKSFVRFDPLGVVLAVM